MIFGNLERVDDVIILQVFKKSVYKFTGAKLGHSVGVLHTRFFKGVAEGDGGRQLFVGENLLNSKHAVIFKLDIHKSVLLTRNVEKG